MKKEFDYEKAKAGAPVCTREGNKARIVCWDANNEGYPIIALVENDDHCEFPYSYTRHGLFDMDEESPMDLMLLIQKHEGYITLYKQGLIDGKDKETMVSALIFKTPEEAVESMREACEGSKTRFPTDITIHIEWEE